MQGVATIRNFNIGDISKPLEKIFSALTLLRKEKVCKNCGQTIDKKAVICTSCGVKTNKPIFKKWWFWAIAVIIVITIGTSNNTGNNNTTNNNTGASVVENNNFETSNTEKNSPKISKAEFEALETGITYEEAVVIIGGEGELSSQVNVAGYDTKMYTWEGEGSIGANANATFQNNTLTSKAQYGLK